jgi:hypothetical protein
MNAYTNPGDAPAPSRDPFEDQLLSLLLDDFDEITRPAERRRPTWPASVGAWAVPVAGAAAVATVVFLVGGSGGHSSSPATTQPGASAQAITPARHTPSTKHLVLYKLADASVADPALKGRYVVLSETDSDSSQSGQSHRTSVIDPQTGSSVTYQQPGAGNSAPARLTSAPDPTNTEAWYAALPTDPTALRARLLGIARAQQDQANALNEKKLQLSEADAHGKATATPTPVGPQLSDDDLVYAEANDLLWSPLVPPRVRAALYKVLATTDGYTLDANATDPTGRPAISMTRTSRVDGVVETDITYENPTTGAVLAQTWKTGAQSTTATYRPATARNTMPANPYSGS